MPFMDLAIANVNDRNVVRQSKSENIKVIRDRQLQALQLSVSNAGGGVQKVPASHILLQHSQKEIGCTAEGLVHEGAGEG